MDYLTERDHEEIFANEIREREIMERERREDLIRDFYGSDYSDSDSDSDSDDW